VEPTDAKAVSVERFFKFFSVVALMDQRVARRSANCAGSCAPCFEIRLEWVALSVGDGSQSKSINEQMNTVGEQLEALTIQKESESARVNSSKLFDKLLSYLESTNNVAFNIAETEAGQLRRKPCCRQLATSSDS